MSKSVTYETPDYVEPALDAVARSLREAAELTKGLSEDASAVLASAAADVARMVEKQGKQAVRATRSVTRQASKKVRRHPIASIAAALAATATVIGLISARRNHRNAAS